MSSIISIITQLLSYSDGTGTTDNPNLRNFDWSRYINAVAINNPASDKVTILPNQSKVLFDGLRDNPLDATSVLEIESLGSSIYRLSVTSGSSGFRDPRSITNLQDCTVTINNSSVATFTFSPTTAFPDTVVGDIMRVSGVRTYDTPPFSFNDLNSGLWSIIAVSGNVIQAVRRKGVAFEGAAEAVTAISATELQIYSADGVQAGDKFDIKGAFSTASQRVYEVLCVSPAAILFTSAISIPEEANVAYPDPVVNGHSLVFYSNAKRLIYMEVDQDVAVRFNGDPGDTNKVSPIEVSNSNLVGYLHKTGITYKTEVVNKSINPVSVLYFIAE